MIIVDIDSSCLFTQRRHKIQELKHMVSLEREVVVVLVAEADWKLGLLHPPPFAILSLATSSKTAQPRLRSATTSLMTHPRE